MDTQRYLASPWARPVPYLGLLIVGSTFFIGTPSVSPALLLAPFFFHELVRQARPILIVSDEFLTWQPPALWRPEVSVPMKDITRVRCKWSRILSVKLRDGSLHRVNMNGISLSERRLIPKIIENRIGPRPD